MIPSSLIFSEAAETTTAREQAHMAALRLVAFVLIGIGVAAFYTGLEPAFVSAFPEIAPLELDLLLFASLLVPAYQLHRRFCFPSEIPHLRAAMRYATVQLGVLCLARFLLPARPWHCRPAAPDDPASGLRADRRRELFVAAHLGVFVALTNTGQGRDTACALRPKRIC